MPCYPRLFIPGIPLHIVQRGHDQQAVFVQRADFEYYLSNLFETKRKLFVKLHAYCLMTNHVHLILSPGLDANNISKLLRVLAARQTRYVNKLECRTGTLWEGRFKASLIDTDAYLLACYRYVELNPVRAAIVASPEDYDWSSYRFHASLEENDSLDHSDTFLSLGRTKRERALAYLDLVAKGLSDSELSLIRAAVKRNQLTGTVKFEQEIAQRTGRRIATRGQGRPKAKK